MGEKIGDGKEENDEERKVEIEPYKYVVVNSLGDEEDASQYFTWVIPLGNLPMVDLNSCLHG